jgi:hypothetical protein
MKVNLKGILLFIVMIVGFVALIALIGTPGQQNENLAWTEVLQKFEDNEVTGFTVTASSVLKMTATTDGKEDGE